MNGPSGPVPSTKITTARAGCGFSLSFYLVFDPSLSYRPPPIPYTNTRTILFFSDPLPWWIPFRPPVLASLPPPSLPYIVVPRTISPTCAAYRTGLCLLPRPLYATPSVTIPAKRSFLSHIYHADPDSGIPLPPAVVEGPSGRSEDPILLRCECPGLGVPHVFRCVVLFLVPRRFPTARIQLVSGECNPCAPHSPDYGCALCWYAGSVSRPRCPSGARRPLLEVLCLESMVLRTPLSRGINRMPTLGGRRGVVPSLWSMVKREGDHSTQGHVC